MSQKHRIVVFLTFFSTLIPGFAQTPTGGKDLHVNSPYSRFGIGDLAPVGNLRNIGMGGVGVSYGHPEFINSLNPALLINNRVTKHDSLLTIMEGSIMGQSRRISDINANQWSSNLSFNSFAYVVPVSKRWTTNIGIHPFSTVSYSLYQKSPVANSSDTAQNQYNGYGGIYQADFANGIKINKNFNIGIQASYIFGTISNESLSQIYTQSDPLKVGSTVKTAHSGFLFRPGFAYRKQLQKGIARDSAVFVNFGFTYEFFGNLKASESLLIQRRNQYNILIDQTTASTKSQSISFAPTYRFGLSFDKFQNWNVGADFSYSNWSAYKGISQVDLLKNSFTIALGSEIAFNPGKNISDRDKVLKKNYFRTGVSYSQTPYYVNGRQINDMALSVGYSFPVGSSKKNYSGLPMPKLNAALVIGQRGSHSDNLVKDLYFKLYFGLTLNDKWFRRRKID